MTVECREIRQLLNVYLDGECTAEERAVIESHLASCEACRTEWHSLQARTAWVAQAAEPLPTDLHASIMARVTAGPLLKKRKASHMRAIVTAVAACAVVCLMLGVGWRWIYPKLSFLSHEANQTADVMPMSYVAEYKQIFLLSAQSEGAWLCESAEYEPDASQSYLVIEGETARMVLDGAERSGEVSYGLSGLPERLIFADRVYTFSYDGQGGMNLTAEG